MSDQRTIQEIQRSMRLKKTVKMTTLTILIFTVAILYFSPVLYMHLSAFKTEYDAVSPSLFFSPTLETFRKVLGDETMYGYLKNSLFQVCAGTIICLLLGIPAAFALTFGKFKHQGTNKKVYFWFLTTILLPPVAVATTGRAMAMASMIDRGRPSP